MTQQGETTTDHLIRVITNLKLERRSGQLTVRRGEGLTAEEGRLIFVQGQITQASVGKHSGPDALNRLSTWRQARYIFTPAASRHTTLLPPLSHSSNGAANNGAANHRGPLATWNNPDQPEKEEPLQPSEVPIMTVVLTKAAVFIDQAGLPRSYRGLSLLIDGSRSCRELALLLGKTPDEVRAMLQNLERLGVVQWIKQNQR